MKRILAALFLAAALASAQNVSCLLSGTLQDSTDAVIPGAEIKLSATSTGFVRTTKTNSEGFFSFPDLTPATFTLSISVPGFKSYSQSGIAISSGEQRSAGVVRLQLGGTTETISVTAEQAPGLSASGERAGVLTATELSEVALKGRDFMGAVSLLPGVVDLNEDRESPNVNSTASVYIMGGRDSHKNMTVDGVTNLDVGSTNAVTTMPSMDSVAELKVLMSNYAAEYGRNSGGTVTVITKGGQRQFHATGGWYHRHEQFCANNYFDNRNGVPRKAYRYNIFSYTLGGPVYIPGKFNTDRSKLFFFLSQEFQQQLVTVASQTVRVPTALERAGDFSQTNDVNGRLVPVYDPLNGMRQFPNNVIPAGRLTRTGQNVLKLFPLPNFVDPMPSRLYQWNFIATPSYPYPRRTEIIRLDYSPRQNAQFYVRLSNNAAQYRPTWGSWVTGSVNFPLTRMIYLLPGDGGVFHSTFTLSPSMFNEFIFGVTRNVLRYYPETPEAISRQATGIDIPQWYPQNNAGGLIPNMSFGSVSNAANPSMYNAAPNYTNSTTYSFVDNLSKVYGTQTLKFGFYVERSRKDQAATNPIRGSVAFDRDRANPLDTNFAYANALLGVYQSYSEASAQPRGRLRFTNFEWYAQDDWRVRPRFFLNYGLRFYYDLPAYDAMLQAATFVPSLYDSSKAPVLLRPALDSARNKIAVDPLKGTTYPAILVGTFVPGIGSPANGTAVGGKNGFPRTLMTTPHVTLGPRVGFSWDPFGRSRTTVRGGGGVFYNRIFLSPITNNVGGPPIAYTPTLYYGTLDGLAQMAGQGALAPTNTYSLWGYQGPTTVYNFSLGIQQQIGRRSALDVSYVGSLGRHLNWTRNINPVPIGARFLDLHPENRDPSTTSSALPTNFLRLYQGWGDITMYEFGASSNYNSLQVSASRRMSRGQIVVGYTFSKALGTQSGDYTSRITPFFPPRSWNYGVLDQDRTNVLTLRYNYELPQPGRHLKLRWMGLVTDHWEISGVSRFVSGAPFTPGLSTVDGQDITGTPSLSARPTVANPSADPVHRFGRPARGTFGNMGANVLRGPGTNNWDISVYRRIPLREGGKSLQLRFESYNTFNHTQFSSVSTTARFDLQGNQVDPLFLEPTAARSPRRLQLAMRFNW